MTMTRRIYFLLLGTSLLAFQHGVAAQEALMPQSPAPGASDEIIVTAQKRSQDVQNVPISMSVVSGQAIADAGIVRFQDLATSIPNFTVSANPSSDTIALRGISSASQPGGEQSVGVFVDGIYRGRGIQSRFAFLDLDRIEVLRGPQGTLYGKNTIAGAVNITTAKPTRDLTADFLSTYNITNREIDLRGHISGPVTDTLSARVAFLYDKLDRGWVYNIITGQHMPQKRDWAVRGSLLWEPVPALRVNLRYEHGDLHQDGVPAETTKIGPSLAAAAKLFNLPGVVAGLDGRTSITNGLEPIPGVIDPPGQNGPALLFNAKSNEAAAQADLDVGTGTISAIGGYSAYHFDRTQDVDFNPVPVAQNIDAESFRQFSGELRYVSDAKKPLSYLVGGYYSNEHLDNLSTGVVNYAFLDAFSCLAAGRAPGCSALAAFNPGLTSKKILNQTSETWAVFGQATYRPVDTVTIIAGLRYGQNHKVATQSALAYSELTGALVNEPIPGLFLLLPLEIAPHVLQGRVSDSRVLPQISARWEFVPNVSVFVSYAKGSQDGGFNALNSSASPNGLTFRPERADDYEVGLRSQFDDRRITLNLTYYHVKFDDLQVTQFTGNTSFIVSNAAAAVTQGVEFDARWRPFDKLVLTGAGAYNDFKFSNFRNAGCTSDQTNFGNAGGKFPSAAACAAAGTNDLSGRTNQNAPKMTLTINARYSQPLGKLVATAFGEAVHSSSYFASTNLDPNLLQRPFTKFNASLGAGPADGRWEIAVVGQNLGNARTFFYGNITPLFAGSFQVYVERTRNVAIRGKIRF